jgi:hypothetical protein
MSPRRIPMNFKNFYQLEKETIRIGEREHYPIERVHRIVVEEGNGLFWWATGIVFLLTVLGIGWYHYGSIVLYLLPGAFYFFWRGWREDRKTALGLEIKKKKYGKATEYIPLIEAYRREKIEQEVERLRRELAQRQRETIRVVRKRY